MFSAALEHIRISFFSCVRYTNARKKKKKKEKKVRIVNCGGGLRGAGSEKEKEKGEGRPRECTFPICLSRTKITHTRNHLATGNLSLHYVVLDLTIAYRTQYLTLASVTISSFYSPLFVDVRVACMACQALQFPNETSQSNCDFSLL